MRPDKIGKALINSAESFMRWFLTRLSLCFILCTIVCMIVMAVGGRQAKNAFFSDLDQCGIAICYLGTRPGVTTWDESQALFQHALQVGHDATVGTVFFHQEPDYSVVIQRSYQPSSNAIPMLGVVEIGFSPFFRVGDVINKFGNPCYIGELSTNLTLLYPNAEFIVLGDHVLTPDAYIWHIFIEDLPSEVSCEDQRYLPDIMYNRYEWQGFRNAYITTDPDDEY